MSLRDLIILLIVINGWALLLYVLVRTQWLQRLNMALFGPALMIKTQRGRGLLDWLAKARGFFDAFAGVGVYLTAAVMLFMSLLLVLQLLVIFRIPPDQAPSPSLILGIPGVNPIIPLGYGIIALIFAVVVHELAHGVLARVHKIPVRTMGILLLIIPIGAFVEPDEEALKRASRRKRIKVFGAGPMTNLAFALVFALVFSPLVMAQARPIEGAPIQAVEAEPGRPNPACAAGIFPGAIVTHFAAVNGTREPVRTREDLSQRLNSTTPGETVELTIRQGNAPAGAQDVCATSGPAAGTTGVVRVTPAACWQQYGNETCQDGGRIIGHPDALNRTVVGIRLYPAKEFHDVLVNPLGGVQNFVFYISLPFLALQGQFPLEGQFKEFYEVPGNADVFWIAANLLYWLFWINLMLGLTNALPIVPLDGGHMFRDYLGGWMDRRRPDLSPERRDAIVRRVSIWVALLLLALVLLQFIGPRIAGIFA